MPDLCNQYFAWYSDFPKECSPGEKAMYRTNHRCIYTDFQVSFKGGWNSSNLVLCKETIIYEAMTSHNLRLRGHGAAEVKVADLIFFSNLFLSILIISVSQSLERVKKKGPVFSLKGGLKPNPPFTSEV